MPIFEGLMSNIYFNDSTTSWSDPTDDILKAIRELSFRTSLYAAADPSLAHLGNQVDPRLMSNQTLLYTGYSYKAVYSTDWRYMAAGLVVAILAVLSVLPLFYGFWELGRHVSMSPLEIANAFEAPLLVDIGSNCNAREIMREAGLKNVVYGACKTTEPSSHWTCGLGSRAMLRNLRMVRYIHNYCSTHTDLSPCVSCLYSIS